MSSTASSPLLKLPRELRNYIYDHVHKTIHFDTILEGQQCPTHIKNHTKALTGAPQPGLLLVKRQIHDEYQPYAQARMKLVAAHYRKQHHFKLESSILHSILAEVRVADLVFGWRTIVFAGPRDQHRQWGMHLIQSGHARLPDGRSPLKWFSDDTEALLSQLSQTMHAQASVRIQLNLTGLPDLEDPFTWLQFAEGPGLQTAVRLADQAVDVPAIVKTLTTTNRPWPSAGKLSVVVKVFLPLYCGMASNTAEVSASRYAWESGEIVRVTKPESVESGERIKVTLLPTNDLPNWRGFWPAKFEELEVLD